MGLWRNIESLYSLKISDYQPVRDVFRITTKKEGVLCLKSFAYAQHEVQFIAEAMEYLRGSGFPYVPEILRSADNSLWVRIKQRKFMLTQWVQGRHPDFSHPVEYRQAIQTLARFHQHTEGFVCSHCPTCRKKVDQLDHRIRRTHQLLQQTEFIPIASRTMLLDFCDTAQSRLHHPMVQQGIAQEAIVGAFAHGDFNYPNLVRDIHGVLHVIDFDATAYQVRMVDLAHLLQRNCRWSGENILRWVEVYDGVRTLSDKDRAILTVLLHIPETIARQIRLQSRRNKSASWRWPSARTLRAYSRRVNQIL